MKTITQSFFFRRFVWALLSFTMPRRRPLEIIYGRARYCLSLFDDELTPENCARNWVVASLIVNGNSILAMAALYGDAEAMQIAADTSAVYANGYAFYTRRNEKLSDEVRLQLAQQCWRDMQHQLHQFLYTEPENVTQGAKIHCQSLRDGKHSFYKLGLFGFPHFSL